LLIRKVRVCGVGEGDVEECAGEWCERNGVERQVYAYAITSVIGVAYGRERNGVGEVCRRNGVGVCDRVFFNVLCNLSLQYLAPHARILDGHG